jgi:hypothetical protein
LAIWLLKCFYETFVQGSTAVILLDICAKNPPYRRAVKRCVEDAPLRSTLRHNYVFAQFQRRSLSQKNTLLLFPLPGMQNEAVGEAPTTSPHQPSARPAPTIAEVANVHKGKQY